VEDFMKEKGALKREEEAMKKVRELQEQLANLRSTEVKRLEELNAQAIALERERDRQRLFREEQALKARGELSKAEADRIAKEREMQERINQTMAEQERAKRDEVAALAAEQDKIKRAQLENEQRWNDLSRKAKLSQDSWTAIDDSLSLKQAITEVRDLKKEIANLKGRLDYQYNENTKNLKAAYAQQRALSGAKLPPAPAPKDAFETTTEYDARISAYKQQVGETEKEGSEAVEILKKEETLKLAVAKADYLEQQIRVLSPFVQRLRDLQKRKFTISESGAISVALGEPDADNNRFPLLLQYNGKSWSESWNYTDRNSAKDFYRTRTYLKAEGFFQIEETAQLSPKLTAARVTHLGTKEVREFPLETPRTFIEIDQFDQFQREKATTTGQFAKFLREEIKAKVAREKSARLHVRKETGRDSKFIAYNDGTVLDTRTRLMWAAKDNGDGINWSDAKSYCANYRGGGYTDWRLPAQDELVGLYDKAKTYKSACNFSYELFGCRVHLTELIRLTCNFIWASETRDSKATYFDFYSGNWGWSNKSAFGLQRVLPVRSDK
jgi:hypothetical protein